VYLEKMVLVGVSELTKIEVGVTSLERLAREVTEDNYLGS